MPARKFSSLRASSRARYYLAEHGIEPTVVAARAIQTKFGLTPLNPPNVVTLRKLIAGKHPLLDFQLRSNRTISGWEWSEGVPKTVSLCALVAPSRVRHAVKCAAQATVDLVARIATPHGIYGACDDTLFERVSSEPNWHTPCFASLHHYSRSADPHEHVHFLLFNAIHSGSRWVAADVSCLFQHAKLISQYFHGSLAMALSQQGVRLRDRVLSNGVVVWEIEGVPRIGIRSFSRRTAAIQSAKGSDKQRKFGTRPKKEEVNEERIRIEALSRLSQDQVRSLVVATASSGSATWPSPNETIREFIGTERAAGIRIARASELLRTFFRNPAACADLHATIQLTKTHASLFELGGGLWGVGREWSELEKWLGSHVVSIDPKLSAGSLSDIMRVRDVAIVELPSTCRNMPRSWDNDNERQRGLVRRQIARSIPCFEATGSTMLRDILGSDHTIYPIADIGAHWEPVRKTPLVCLSLASRGLTPDLLQRLRFESTRFVLIAPAKYSRLSDFGKYLTKTFPVCRAAPTKHELRSIVRSKLTPALKSSKVVTFLDMLQQTGSCDPSGVDASRVLCEHDNGRAPLVVCPTSERADRFLSAFHTLLDRTAADRQCQALDAYEPDPSNWDTSGWFHAYVRQNIVGAKRGSIVRVRTLTKDCAEIATMRGTPLAVLPRALFPRLLPLREATRKIRVGELIRFPATCHTIKNQRLSMHRPYRVTGFLEERGHTLISLKGRYLISGTMPVTVSPCVCVFNTSLSWEADTIWLDFTAPELAAAGGVPLLRKLTTQSKYGLHLCGDTLPNYRKALLVSSHPTAGPDLTQQEPDNVSSVMPRKSPEANPPTR